MPFPAFPGHAARVSPSGSPLPHLPSLHLACLLCHLCAHCSVRTRQCGCGSPDEAPGGQQQGGPAGGARGESRDEREGRGQPTPHCGICGRRLGDEHGSTCTGNGTSYVGTCEGVENVAMTAVLISWQVQLEDEECSHGNLLSMGRMLSLPSDNYPQPLRCSPYPPIGHEAYVSYSYSGTLASNSQLKEKADFSVLKPLPGFCKDYWLYK